MWKSYIIIFVLFVSAGCSKVLDDIDTSNTFFEFTMNVNEEKEAYQLNDTLWFETTIKPTYTDSYSNNNITVDNATVLISCVVNKLHSEIDTIDFIGSNFNLIIENGGLELVNVIDNDQTSYIFDLKYGLPYTSNKLKVGLILSYPGAFAVSATGKIFYGENRTDYTDLTGKDNVADVNYIFDVSSVNESILTNLPSIEYNYFKNIYPESMIDSKQVYFVDIKNH